METKFKHVSIRKDDFNHLCPGLKSYLNAFLTSGEKKILGELKQVWNRQFILWDWLHVFTEYEQKMLCWKTSKLIQSFHRKSP